MAQPSNSEMLAALLEGPFPTAGEEGGSEPQSANTFAARSWAGIVADLAALGGLGHVSESSPTNVASERAIMSAAIAARVQAAGPLSAALSNAVNADLAQSFRVMLGFDLLSTISFSRTARDALVTACQIALARKFPSFAQDGFRTLFTKPPVVYLSAALESHAGFLSTQLGFPRSSIVIVPNRTVNNAPQLDPVALKSLVERDAQELRVPLLVAASNGANGQLDDISEIAAITSEAQLWLHAEGDRVVFQSAERGPAIDSFLFSPGTWFGMGWAPSSLVFRQLDARESAIANQSAVLSAQLLPLWITLRSLGLEGATAIVRKAVALVTQAHASFTSLPGVVTENASLAPLTHARFVYRGVEGDEEGHVQQINELLWPALVSSFPDLPFATAATGAGHTCLHVAPFARSDPLGETERIEAAAASAAETLHRVVEAKSLRHIISESLTRHPGLQLADYSLVAAVPVRYLPPYLSDMTEDAGRAELTRINRALVPHANADPDAPYAQIGVTISEHVGPDGSVFVAIGAPPTALSAEDVETILTSIAAHGHALEDPSMHLDKLSKTLQQGILQAQQALEREQEARMQEEGLLRQVPLVSSVLNWFSPPVQKSTTRAGRAFDLSSGTIMQTFAESAESDAAAPASSADAAAPAAPPPAPTSE